ncbi:MAG: Gfo/Idh/MocA family oxidoreductase [Chloroflexi bacterium]|nr:Gfo/Idh/MocA family oxidoreductase [Chloroflexota bacterium]
MSEQGARLKTGVIGLGVGRTHIQGYQAASAAEPVAVADVNEAALERAKADYGIPTVYTDYRELLADDAIGAVSICTPDKFHAEQALAALDAGKHVLCEKPLALTAEEARAIVQKVRDTGLKFMMCHNYRFIPQFAELKQRLDSKILGQVYYGDSSYVQDLYSMAAFGPDYWRFKDPQNFYLGGAVHNVDLLLWLLGEVVEVSAYSNHAWEAYPIDENYVSNFRFADGSIGRVLLLLGSHMKDEFFVDLNIYGAGGALKATMQSPHLIVNVADLPSDRQDIIRVELANSHHLAIAAFVNSVLEDRTPPITVEDGARTVAVCLAAIESAREGRPVQVDYGLM